MKLKITFFVLMLTGLALVGQNKHVADRYFKEYSYAKAAELYSSIYSKGNTSQKVLSNLADSYFYMGDMENAIPVYEKLIAEYSNSISSKRLFKYYQALKGVGKYKESDAVLDKYKNIKDFNYLKSSVESNPDYLSDLKRIKTPIKIHNVSVNTKYSDFGSFVQGEQVYYATTKPIKNLDKEKIYGWNEQPYLNLYVANLQELKPNKLKDSTVVNLVEGKILEEPIRTHYHEATVAITKDGNTMYFTRDNYDGKKVKKDKNRDVLLKLYKAKLVGGKWDQIVELPFNSNDFSTGHPALSNDEKTLYFVSDRPGGFGSTDLYKVTINGDKYGVPQNLGDKINTPKREMFPYLDVNNTLYYSTDGFLGLGLLDIFKAKQQIDGGFEIPENLQAPINSDRDDFAYWVSSDGKKGFFSSNRLGGKGDDDIYSFEEYEEKCEQKIFGIVTETKTGEIIPNAIVRLIDKNGGVVKSGVSDEKGHYSFNNVPCDTEYTLVGSKTDYKQGKKKVVTTSKKGQEIEANIQLSALIVDNQIVISPIYFDYDKHEIRSDAAYELEHIVTVMNNHPDMVIKIESHTDCRGGANYNRILSDKRAKSTRDYIISRGIATQRIESAIGYGKDQLLFNCNNNCNSCSEEQHQKNRRSYFYILKGKKNIEVKGQD